MSFEKLISELSELGAEQEQMSKALPADDGADDDKIQAAAADGGDGDGAGADAGADAGDGDGASKDDDGEPMGKSLGMVTLENGEQVDAIDGTELVKALMARVETTEGQMQKALEGAVGLIKGQSAMIKSLSDQVAKLAGAGRGRKAAVTVHEKVGGAPLNKSEPAGMNADEFMAKALTAQAAGKIRGVDVAMIENCVNRGIAVPEGLVNKVVGQ